jgi:hypothetical protein
MRSWQLHEFGFRLQSEARGQFHFFRPDGTEVVEVVSPPTLGHDPETDLRTAHHAAGLGIDTETNLCGWDGRPADVPGIVAGLVAGVG